MKKVLVGILICIMTVFCFSMATGCSKSEIAAEGQQSAESGASSPLIGSPDETYYMVTFLSGAAYWVGCYEGMEAAAELYGVKTVYTGTAEYDVNKQVTAFDQVAAKKPAGIAITAINPDAFIVPINKAMDSGIPVVAFDSDSPDSKALSFLCTDNYEAGIIAGKKTIELIGEGTIGILERPGQLCIDQRVAGYKDAIAASENMEVIITADAGGDETKAATAVSNMISSEPDLDVIFACTGIEAIGAATAVKESGKPIKVVTFDSDAAVVQLIKEGLIFCTLEEQTYSMGYWTMVFLYNYAHGLVNPPTDWKEVGTSPMPQYVDTGINVITAENVDFYVEKYANQEQ